MFIGTVVYAVVCACSSNSDASDVTLLGVFRWRPWDMTLVVYGFPTKVLSSLPYLSDFLHALLNQYPVCSILPELWKFSSHVGNSLTYGSPTGSRATV